MPITAHSTDRPTHTEAQGPPVSRLLDRSIGRSPLRRVCASHALCVLLLLCLVTSSDERQLGHAHLALASRLRHAGRIRRRRRRRLRGGGDGGGLAGVAACAECSGWGRLLGHRRARRRKRVRLLRRVRHDRQQTTATHATRAGAADPGATRRRRRCTRLEQRHRAATLRPASAERDEAARALVPACAHPALHNSTQEQDRRACQPIPASTDACDRPRTSLLCCAHALSWRAGCCAT